MKADVQFKTIEKKRNTIQYMQMTVCRLSIDAILSNGCNVNKRYGVYILGQLINQIELWK